MATSPQNRVTREVAPVQVFPDAQPLTDSTISYNQGDLLYLDTSAHLIKALNTVADDSQTFLGIAPVTVVSGKLKSSYSGTAVDAAQSGVALSGPIAGVVAKMKLKTGDAFNPGDVVYHSIADDAQTVTSSAPSAASHAIGVYQDNAVASAASGAQGNIHLGHRFPGDTLVL